MGVPPTSLIGEKSWCEDFAHSLRTNLMIYRFHVCYSYTSSMPFMFTVSFTAHGLNELGTLNFTLGL